MRYEQIDREHGHSNQTEPSEQDKQRRKQPDHADKELFLPSAKSPAQLFWTGPQLYSHVDSHFYNHYLILG